MKRIMDHVPTRKSPAACAARRLAVVLACMISLPAGCTPAPDRKIQVAADPLADARGVVARYAAGDPLGSEMETYDDLLARVGEVDQTKAEKLRTFFDANRKSPAGLKKRAEAILSEL